MSALQVGTAFLVGAAGLALWVDSRLGDRPRSVTRVVVHAAAAWLAVHLVAVFGTQLIDSASTTQTAAVLMLLVLPGWIYLFLAALWSLKLIRGALAR